MRGPHKDPPPATFGICISATMDVVSSDMNLDEDVHSILGDHAGPHVKSACTNGQREEGPMTKGGQGSSLLASDSSDSEIDCSDFVKDTPDSVDCLRCSLAPIAGA